MFSRKLQNGVGVKKAESRYFPGLFVVGAPGIEPWASYEIRIFERESANPGQRVAKSGCFAMRCRRLTNAARAVVSLA